MIYGKTHHPVFVKKISLSIWTLRDEIEALILEKLNQLGVTDPADLTPEQLEEVKDFYRTKDDKKNANVLKFVKKAEADLPVATEELEAKVEETAQAMAEAGPEAEVAEEKVEEPETTPEAPKEAAKDESIVTEVVKADEMIANSAPPPVELPADLKNEIAAVLPAMNKETSPFRKKPILLDPSKQSSGVLVLSDVNMDEILFFSKLPFDFGQAVVIEFLIPQYFVMGAEIVACNRYNLKSRIINPTRPEYRLRAKFNFQTVGERTLLRTFLKSIEPDIPVVKKKKPVTEEASTDDDLSELGI